MREDAIEVIPVIDLMGGAVVRARHGLRHTYAPIETPGFKNQRASRRHRRAFGDLSLSGHSISPISTASNPGAAMRKPSILATAAFPGLVFWIDAGVRDALEARSWLARHKGAILSLEANPWKAPRCLLICRK